MLHVSPTANAALQAQARPAFAVRVRVALVDAYPDVLEGFPQDVQQQIVNNMLGRASLWGLTQQSSLLAYCEFMLTIAANFDEEPEIHSALQNGPRPLDNAVRTLPDTVSEASWDRAHRRRSNLPLYIAPNMVGQPVRDQTIAALPLALFDRPEARTAATAVAQAAPYAQMTGLQDFPDGLLLMAGVRAFYGPDIMRERWGEDLRRANPSPGDLMDALRDRLRQDHGRFL